jgi:uncharacterized protein (TIGR03083 family)
VDYFVIIAAERLALADTLSELSPAQWETRSLCGEWTVRDVAAHLIVPLTKGAGTFILAFVSAQGDLHKASRKLTARVAARPTAEIIADLRAQAQSRFRPPSLGPEAPLSEVLLHGEDIRVPLGIADERPVERWRGALDFLVTPKAVRGFVPRGLPALRYVASDLDWSHDSDAGSGQEVRGPAAALALAMAGREARVGDLSGPGAETLASWVSGQS